MKPIAAPIAIGALRDHPRINGSLSNVKALPSDGGDPNPDHPPAPPPPPISGPDLALEFEPCLKDFPVAPGVDLAADLISGIQNWFGESADVRYACLSGKGRVGIWLQPSTNEATNQARKRGLAHINVLLPENENCAVYVSASYIKREALRMWETVPKRLDGDFNPSADGPILLSGLSIDFQSPNKIVTRISGTDQRPLPDVDFTLRITDRFTVSASELRVDGAASLDADTDWLFALSALSLILTAANPLFAIPFLGLWAELMVITSADPGAMSVAAAITAQRIPKEVLLRGGQKLMFLYRRTGISQDGLSAGGAAVVVSRSPSVSISGPTRIVVNEGERVAIKTYTLATSDMRPGFSVVWTGDGFPIHLHSSSATAHFNLSQLNPDGTKVCHIHVRVADADGLVAESSLSVTVYMTSSDASVKPICRVKPWLPECK